MNIRTFWKARAGTNLNKFTKSSETSSSVILTNAPDAITEAGTPFTAAAMNSIENRISDNQLLIQALTTGGSWKESLVQNGFTALTLMGFDYSGNVFICDTTAKKIYKQTGGEGLFVDMELSTSDYRAIAYSLSGDQWIITGNPSYDVLKNGSPVGSAPAPDFLTIFENSNETYDVYISSIGNVYKSTGGTGIFSVVSGWPSNITQTANYKQEYLIGIDTNKDLIKLNLDGTYSTIYTGTVGRVSISSSGDIYIIEGGYLKKSIDEGFTFSNVIATSATEIDIGRDGKIYLHDASEISRLSYSSIVVDLLYPVGSFYTQYPDADSNDEATAFPTSKRPEALFGGKWDPVFNTEAIVFRTEGSPIEAQDDDRTDGLQTDQLQNVTGSFPLPMRVDGGEGSTAGAFSSSIPGNIKNATAADGTTGRLISFSLGNTARAGLETRMRNRLVKIWKRTA